MNTGGGGWTVIGPMLTSSIFMLNTISDASEKKLVNAHHKMNQMGNVYISLQVILRRNNGSVDFLREWEDYKNGFGSLDGEVWAGNCLCC